MWSSICKQMESKQTATSLIWVIESKVGLDGARACTVMQADSK